MRIKRLLLLFFLSAIFLDSQAATISKQYQGTVGVSFTIDPLADCGETGNAQYLTSMNGLLNTYDNNLYNATQFTYTVTDGTTNRVFTITPQVAGTYSFRVILNFSTNSQLIRSWYHEIYYSIYAVDVTNISLNFTDLTLNVGESQQITPTITHPQAETTLDWVSSDNSVATVSQSGNVTAKGVGTATITCTAHNGVSAQCQVTVKPIMVQNITMNETSSTLTIDDTHQLSVKVSPSNATDKSVTWSSTDETVAVVNENGLVTALAHGKCQIKATANDGSGKVASCLVTVLGNVIYCEDFSAVPGAKISVPIFMKNVDAIQGFKFDLSLPKGISVVTEDGTLTGTPRVTPTERLSDGIRCELFDTNTNNTYRFVYTSIERITGSSGAVVEVPIGVHKNMAVGMYDVTIKDIELTDYVTSAPIHLNDRTAKLSLENLLLGDVNGDTQITVSDAISIINYVLERRPVSFIELAADVNKDGGITLADAVKIVDIIFGHTGSNVKADVLQHIFEPQ